MQYSGSPEYYDGKQHESYESMQQRAILLGKVIQKDILLGKIELPTKIMHIPRGGYYIADTMTRMMGLSSIDNIFMAAKSYNDETKQAEKLVFGQTPKPKDVINQHILIVDEVCETGATLEAADKLVTKLGASSVVSAVSHYKPTRSTTGYIPDYWAELTDQWIEYPSEKVDHLGEAFIAVLLAQQESAR